MSYTLCEMDHWYNDVRIKDYTPPNKKFKISYGPYSYNYNCDIFKMKHWKLALAYQPVSQVWF